MKLHEKLFLEALKASLTNEKVYWDFEIDLNTWTQLFSLAEVHHVVPLVFEAVYRCPAAAKIEPQFFMQYKRRMIQYVSMQAMKTEDFLLIYKKMSDFGVKPLVVKGIICRSLYPQPDYRISTDEDLLVEEEIFFKLHETLLELGLELKDKEQNLQEFEVSYIRPGSITFLEVHKSLFQPSLEAYGAWNCYFIKAQECAVTMNIQGIDIATLENTDHLFYLVCHAFKHFLHGGFGLRQVCDMILFANAYGKSIDWQRLFKQCKEIRADIFTAALFKIGKDYFCFDEKASCYPKEWCGFEIDESDLLQDIIESGIYGITSMSRKRSSNVTLQAVSAENQGKRQGNIFLESLFPSVTILERQYPYLAKHPYLLPVAWVQRMWKYWKGRKNRTGNETAEIIKIGNERITLLKKYGILD